QRGAVGDGPLERLQASNDVIECVEDSLEVLDASGALATPIERCRTPGERRISHRRCRRGNGGRKERVRRDLAVRRRFVGPCRPIPVPILESARRVGVPTGGPRFIDYGANPLLSSVVQDQSRVLSDPYIRHWRRIDDLAEEAPRN